MIARMWMVLTIGQISTSRAAPATPFNLLPWHFNRKGIPLNTLIVEWAGPTIENKAPPAETLVICLFAGTAPAMRMNDENFYHIQRAGKSASITATGLGSHFPDQFLLP